VREKIFRVCVQLPGNFWEIIITTSREIYVPLMTPGNGAGPHLECSSLGMVLFNTWNGAGPHLEWLCSALELVLVRPWNVSNIGI